MTDEEHRRPLALATAAWIELHGATQAYQAAVLRGDVKEAEKIRARCHDILDANLDQNAAAAQAVRNIIGG
jgi:hypothetical protein